MHTASACGKVILCGEHAVVYGMPALALPLHNLQATATASPAAGCSLHAPDLSWQHCFNSTQTPDSAHPLALTLWEGLRHFGLLNDSLPAAAVHVSSQIPIGRGLGSGAAISAALFRVLAAYAGQPCILAETLAFVHAQEMRYHGRPSGIDGEVISRAQPLCFVRGAAPESLQIASGAVLLLGDSGPAPPTHEVVGAVRAGFEADPTHYQALFEAIGQLSRSARAALASGDWPELGQCLNQNHQLLQALQVSSPRLDQLVQTAQDAGAWGAKLSGAGRGGLALALCSPAKLAWVEAAWQALDVRCWQLVL
ncbi:MAG: mevalonate kinase [Candidatus Sericytochromatia bacterium]|nr:mevalonate kinase [Candidatus Sericytochromatia bacterium]